MTTRRRKNGPIQLHEFVPSGPATHQMCAIHGVTGHGGRWHHLASEYLPHTRVIAPDLLGHGHSSFTPPWDIATQVDAIAHALDTEFCEPALIVGHSFGGLIAVHIAHRYPDLVSGLLLLDPALSVDPDLALVLANSTVCDWDYATIAEARRDKQTHAWREVPETFLDNEIAQHAVVADDGRVSWRCAAPAVVTAWNDMAHPSPLPPTTIPTTIVRAVADNAALVSDDYLARAYKACGSMLTHTDVDCYHMVVESRPELVGQLIHALQERIDDTITKGNNATE